MVVLGDVFIDGDENATTFSRIEGDLEVEGNKNVLGLAPIAAPECP